MLDADFTIVESPELMDALRQLTSRYQRAIDASQQAAGRLHRAVARRGTGPGAG